MKYTQLSRLFVLQLFTGLCVTYGSLTTITHAQEVVKGYECKAEESNVLQAVRNGKQATLEAHQKAGCSLPVGDARGFTLYDIAALNSDKDMMAWLVKNGYAKEGRYSERLYKLVQTGLRFLNFDAGVIDGKMNAATERGIIDFQQANKLRKTGEVSPEWLGFFHRKLVKKTQATLANLGFSAGTADGIIGANTRTAMQAFRQERTMPAEDYGYIDDQLIYQIMMAENEATKQAIARREAERAARIKAQQAAQQQEIAKRQAQAQKEAEKARKQAEAAAREAQAQRIAKEKALREEQERLAQTTITPPPKSPKQTLQINTDNNQAQREEQARLAAAEKAKLEAQRQAKFEAEQAKKAAEAQRREQELAERKAEAARQAEKAAKAKALAAEREASKAKSQANLAFKAARSGQSVPVSPDVQIGKPIKSASPNGLKPGGAFNELSGKLKFVRDGNQLSQCFIGSQAIDSSWCEPYYPSGENKQCDAVISRTGIVVSLLCK